MMNEIKTNRVAKNKRSWMQRATMPFDCSFTIDEIEKVLLHLDEINCIFKRRVYEKMKCTLSKGKECRVPSKKHRAKRERTKVLAGYEEEKSEHEKNS